LKIAYFINQYPKVSHTFIRREIAALERLGLPISRYAIRGWDAEVQGEEDRGERERTRHLLAAGLWPVIWSAARRLAMHPVLGWRALRCAWGLSRGSQRAWPFHLFSVAEACLLLDWLQADRVEHVHAHFGTNSAEIVRLARLLGGPPYSFTVHGPEEFDQPQGLHLATKVHGAEFVVAISAFGRSQLLRWLPSAEASKVEVVHCGLETGFFTDPAALTASHAMRLVCIGRLSPDKAPLTLIPAVAQLLAEGLRFGLVLVGDGELRPELERAIAVHGLQGQVRITGWLDSAGVRRELLAARALVLPSFAEGLPVVLMEAMAVGRPVVASRIAGIPELVRDGVDGWLFTPGSPEALVNALRDAIYAGSAQLGQMGRSGLDRVRERHDIDVSAGQLKALFERSRGAAKALPRVANRKKEDR
jgi:glycosyltransferase involved in cell wall biosynthesis